MKTNNINIITNYPIAFDSMDHIQPFGIAANNSRNTMFNKILYSLFSNKPSVLDLGCAGGGFVKDCIDDGCIAYGIDGSDYAKKNNLHEWKTIPDNLLTCDISRPFELRLNNEIMKFDVITAWEVMEHISKSRIDILLNNMLLHLKPNGLIFVSINVASKEHFNIIYNRGDCGEGKHHQNVETIDWWDSFIVKFGLNNRMDILSKFNGQFIRGPGCGCDTFATEERMRKTNVIMEQWATINRCWSCS